MLRANADCVCRLRRASGQRGNPNRRFPATGRLWLRARSGNHRRGACFRGDPVSVAGPADLGIASACRQQTNLLMPPMRSLLAVRIRAGLLTRGIGCLDSHSLGRSIRLNRSMMGALPDPHLATHGPSAEEIGRKSPNANSSISGPTPSGNLVGGKNQFPSHKRLHRFDITDLIHRRCQVVPIKDHHVGQFSDFEAA
jgi:hypothetical protein